MGQQHPVLADLCPTPQQQVIHLKRKAAQLGLQIIELADAA
jgi:hypothetical protein